MQQSEEDDEDEEDYDSSEELMAKAFDIDNAGSDSDLNEAVEYLNAVRKQAQNASKYTYFDSSNVVMKQPDKKYLKESEIRNIVETIKIDENWSRDIVYQFNCMK